MTLTVKVFYAKDNGNKEIRRFPINVSENNEIFKITTDKIRQLYPDLSHGNFQLHWQDSDGDHIVFSCDMEMQEAIKQVQDGVLRIYITGLKTNDERPKVTPEPKPAPKPTPSGEEKQQQQRQDKSSGTSSNQGSFHPGVTCDGCEGFIYGIRYKCCVCPDYDLCSKCEGQGLHLEHDLSMITAPRVNPMEFMPPHMGRYLHRYMQGFMNGNQAGASATSSAQASASTSSAQAGGDNSNSNGGDKCKDKAKFDEYLTNVGANIAAFLDPFGIDVTYDVHHGEETPETASSAGRRGNGCRRGTGRGCGAWKNMQQRTEAEKTSAPTEAQTDKTGEKMETEDNKKTTTEEKTPALKTQANCDVPMDDNVKQQHERSPTDEWTIVPEDGTEVLIPNPVAIPLPFTAPTTSTTATAPAPQAPAAAPHVTPVTAPSSTDTSGRLYPNLRIQQSLDQMLAMGFTNNNGWLTNLLIEHNGDIGTTLDSIKAKAQQQLESCRH